MKKAYCNCCDKEIEEWINYVYPYFVGGDENGVKQYSDYELLLCEDCCTEIKAGRKKPNDCDKIIGVNSEIILDMLQRMVFKREKIPYRVDPNAKLDKRTDGRGWYYYDPCIC